MVSEFRDLMAHYPGVYSWHVLVQHHMSSQPPPTNPFSHNRQLHGQVYLLMTHIVPAANMYSLVCGIEIAHIRIDAIEDNWALVNICRLIGPPRRKSSSLVSPRSNYKRTVDRDSTASSSGLRARRVNQDSWSDGQQEILRRHTARTSTRYYNRSMCTHCADTVRSAHSATTRHMPTSALHICSPGNSCSQNYVRCLGLVGVCECIRPWSFGGLPSSLCCVWLAYRNATVRRVSARRMMTNFSRTHPL